MRRKKTADEIRAIIAEKVEGKVKAFHSDKGHFYQVEGSLGLTASVTSKNCIDKPHLIPWAIGLAIEFLDGKWDRLAGPERDSLIRAAKLQYADVRDSAGTIGGQAHAAIEAYEKAWIESGSRPESIMPFIPEGAVPQVIGACRSAEKAFDKYGVVPIAYELLVGITGQGAGTLDLIVMNGKGELELWDWKSSNGVNDYYAIQTSVYKRFFEKMTKLKIKRVRIMKIDKWSDKIKIYNVPNLKEAEKAFKAVSQVYDWINNNEEKLIEDKTIIKI